MHSRELIKLLKEDGWVEKSHNGTSHKQFVHPSKPGKVTVKVPEKDIPIGTLKAILKQAGL